MEKISFEKYTGAGNDFVLIDRKKNNLSVITPALIRGLCNRRFGIGADGVLVIGENDSRDFNLEYYNADGSTGTLCGNGSRCAISYAGNNGYFSQTTRFYCEGVEYTGEIFADGNVRFDLNPVAKVDTEISFRVDGFFIKGSFADTGSPHLVIFVNDILSESGGGSPAFSSIDDLPVNELGAKIRYHEKFAPAGVNVNFIELRDNRIYIRTYERGVENETLACGTGSTASALVAFYNKKCDNKVELVVKSGAVLTVQFIPDGQGFREISLTGPAKKVFNGEVFINNIIEDLDGKSNLFDKI